MTLTFAAAWVTSVSGEAYYLATRTIWRRVRAHPEARLALPRVGYGFIYHAPVTRVKVELRDSEVNVKLNKVEVRPGMDGLVREARFDEARVTLQKLF